MKKLLLVFLILSLTGCARLTYTTVDGTKTTTATYTRFMTGADSIKAQVGKDEKISAAGQKSIDPAFIESLIKAMSVAK